MMSTSLIEIKNLGKSYSYGTIQVDALKAVDLSIDKGMFLGVTGSSGSGKSTLMNLLGGLDTPSVGSIKVQGRQLSEMDKRELAQYRRQQIGMVFQSFNLIKSYSAIENIAFPLLFADVNKRERGIRAEKILEKVGLSSRRDHRPLELSGGEQQRVAIARALINRPNILLADEPTGNLDSKTSRDIVKTISDLNANQGITVIMISHEEQLLREFSDMMVKLSDGRIISKEKVG
jgi:ABC-type lipoprotein export system ATPase subunit